MDHLQEFPLEQSVKGLDELEGREGGAAVVEGLLQHRPQPPLQILNRHAKGEEVIVKLLHLEERERGSRWPDWGSPPAHPRFFSDAI
jgi:hypothetical protein